MIPGTLGALASMVVAAAVLNVPWLPPVFWTTAVKLWAPSLSAVPGVYDHVLPSTTALPKRVVPSYTRTTSPVANVPVTAPDKLGVVSLVRAAAVTETVAVGTVALTVTAYAVPWAPALPAASSTCALKLCAALVRPAVSKDQVVPETVATPKRVEPSYTATTSPDVSAALTVPDRPRVLSLLVPPVATVPVVGSTLSFAPVTTAAMVGAAVSTVTARVAAPLTLPAASVAVALRVLAPCPMAVTSAALKV